MRLFGLCWLAGAAMCFGSEAAASVPRKPNVVILFPDQLRWAEVGCYGHPKIRTPNMDGLAAQGVRFTHAFSNFPVCSPARSILLSGRYARSNGVQNNQDQEAKPGRPTNTTPTLAEVLKSAGYQTGLVGKWHLAPTPQTLGFTETVRCKMRHRYFGQTFYRNEGEPYVVEDYSPHHETQAAIDYIRAHREQPFLLYLPYGPPHMPVSELPERYQRMYDPAEVVLRENVWVDGKLAYDENWFKIYMWDFQYYEHRDTWTKPLPDGMTLRELTALYDGQVTAIDDCIGRVLGAIRDAGIEEDTIVVLTSDHGDLLGSHGLFNKGRHYDEAARIPIIVRYPRKLQTAVVNTQVASLVDVMPTILELADVKSPKEVQGTSLVPVMTLAQATVGENAAFIETGGAHGIRTLEHFYSIDRASQKQSVKQHLFDMKNDPLQMHDLGDRADLIPLNRQFRKRVNHWLAAAPQPASNPGN